MANSKILLADFVLDCQLIEGQLKKIIELLFKKINQKLDGNIFVCNIDKKKLEELSMGKLIYLLEGYVVDRNLVKLLKRLSKERNKIVHDFAFTLLINTNGLKVSENMKDEILDRRLSREISSANKLCEDCHSELLKLVSAIKNL